MGRTRRKRRQKKPNNFTTCNNAPELITFNKWLKNNGLICNEKLSLAVFDDTGRGVLTTKKINPGEEFMNMPLSLTINILTLLTDNDFNQIFIDNKLNCFEEHNQSLTFQSLLSFYLTYLRSLKGSTKWCIYLNTLPEEYSVPYFLPTNVIELLNPEIKEIIAKQKQIVNSTFNIFKDILNSCCCEKFNLIEFKSEFSLSSYEWAYFTVNTRCVYMDLTKAFNIKSEGNSILCLVKDSMQFALCPYLDMINHSPKARNETKLIVNKNVDISLKNLDDRLFSEVKFSIYTKNKFEPYTQVFICYGDSYNLKLITEYGFYLPNNNLDCVTFDYNNVVSYLNVENIKLSQDQISFIDKHKLRKNLYIDGKGLSFNFYALLMVVVYFYKEDIDVNKVIYSSMDIFCDSRVNKLIFPYIRDRIDVISKSVCEIKNLDFKSFALDNCLELMCQYIHILEKFIKCQSR